MRILILGGRGRLASALARGWAASHEVSCLSRPELDVSDLAAMDRLLAGRRFDALVNGTGLTDVDACEGRREEARTVNAIAPAAMAAAASRHGARLIHFSTDYVLDGLQSAPYTEEDPARPISWYGRTKLDGENAVLADSPSHLVVRVSWVFGPDKPSFVDMIIGRARAGTKVEAVADKFSSPTSASDVAGWLEPFFGSSLPGGLYHACNSGGCSWRDYGAHALECAAAAGVALATTAVAPILLADMKAFKAPRPAYTILSTKKLTRVAGKAPRPWQEAVREYIQQKYASIPPSC
ncbi:MAG: dTDP-4-dehydrorhamnose reductase [Verrucomicrobiae bacterium]